MFLLACKMLKSSLAPKKCQLLMLVGVQPIDLCTTWTKSSLPSFEDKGQQVLEMFLWA